MADVNAPAEKPIVPARRTLLLGLGTTGACVCGQILEQLDWSYGNFDNIPWVKCVILETLELSAALQELTRSAKTIQLHIDRQQYGALISNPSHWDRQIAFSSWNNPSLTGTQDAIEHGANNNRMLGRLALLYPPNFDVVVEALRGALAELRALDPRVAAERYSRSQPEAVNINFSPNIEVYVAGTLAGGTSSGCFIDIGYLLQTLEGYQQLLKTTGIFLLPSGAHTNNQQNANTYAALRELNHFSSPRSRYEQQFPDRPGTPRRMAPGTSPYGYCYLVQARGETGRDYAKLVTAAADYISADLVGGKTNARDGTRTNIANYFNYPDLWGATQKFFTFGMGVIEFPHAKVAKACSLRLAGIGFKALAAGEPMGAACTTDLSTEIPMLRIDHLIPRLLNLPSSSLDALTARCIENVRAQAVQSEDPLHLIRSQIELGFDSRGKSGAHPDLGPGLIPRTIEDNERIVRRELRQALQQRLYVFLETPGQGIQSLASCLSALVKLLEANIKDSENVPKQELTDSLAQANQAEENAGTCRKDLFLAATLGKSAAVRRYVGSCLNDLKRYYRLRLREACAPAMKNIYTEALSFVQAVRRRLDNPECGMLQEVSRIVAQMESLYQATNIPYGSSDNGTSRVINGVELFNPSTTVDEEYHRCIRKTAAQRSLAGDFRAWETVLARELTRTYTADAVRALLAEPNDHQRFDSDGFQRTREWDNYQIMEFAVPARRTFAPLNDITLMTRLMRLVNRDQELDNANQAADLFLNWNPGHPRHRSYANTHFKFVLVNNDDPNAAAFKEWIIARNVLRDPKNLHYIADRHQLMILHERGAFSLGTINELDEEIESQWLSDFNQGTVPSFQARNDIREWIGWSRQEEAARVRLRNLFLVGVAIGEIEGEGSRFRICYPRQDPADRGELELSNDLDQACQALKFKGLEGELITKIAHNRHENRARGILGKIIALVERSDKLFTEGGKPLSSPEILTYLLDYINDDTELSALYREEFPDRVEDAPARKAAGCRRPPGLPVPLPERPPARLPGLRRLRHGRQDAGVQVRLLPPRFQGAAPERLRARSRHYVLRGVLATPCLRMCARADFQREAAGFPRFLRTVIMAAWRAPTQRQ